MHCNSQNPISGQPNIADDDTINRGIQGQDLRDKSMDYDPATGKRTGGSETNTIHNPAASEAMKGY